MAKLFISVLVTLFVAQALADPDSCPNPEDANVVVYSKEHHLDSPQFGRADLFIRFPIVKPISCITITELASVSEGPVTISSIAQDEESVTIRLVSAIKTGFDVQVTAYTK